MISAVTALWYFSQGGASDDKNKASISTGVRWIFRFHMGTLAFGSMLITIMQLIRILTEIIRRKVQSQPGANNACVKCICCCLTCFVAYLDKCVKFIAKNAYIQTAITGSNFCKAAYQAFCLMVRNAARFSVTFLVSRLLIMIGKLAITVLTAWICYIIIMNSYLQYRIYSPVVPIIVVAVLALMISEVFMAVYA